MWLSQECGYHKSVAITRVRLSQKCGYHKSVTITRAMLSQFWVWLSQQEWGYHRYTYEKAQWGRQYSPLRSLKWIPVSGHSACLFISNNLSNLLRPDSADSAARYRLRSQRSRSHPMCAFVLWTMCRPLHAPPPHAIPPVLLTHININSVSITPRSFTSSHCVHILT